MLDYSWSLEIILSKVSRPIEKWLVLFIKIIVLVLINKEKYAYPINIFPKLK